MKDQDFNCSITTNKSAEEAMAAISRIPEWWVTNFEGASQKLGDVFTARVGDTFVTFNITGFIPNTKFEWTVVNCHFPWLNNKAEWTGTKIIFDVSNKNNLTTINLTHQGLVPHSEGYDNFVKGWRVYVQGSLMKLLNEGIGQPT